MANFAELRRFGLAFLELPGSNRGKR